MPRATIFPNGVTGPTIPANAEYIGADVTLTTADNGKTFWSDKSLTVTLFALEVGSYVRFINMAEPGTGELEIAPSSGQNIHWKGASVNDKKVINTLATQTKGDEITLMRDDNDSWIIPNVSGVWAREP